ncbi:equilibrative nucleoside transporter 1-like [Haliotis rufescens]|uniref:equilibrative nucleoside transporter 1-like n=1 Tax=Haliotis rufescens TaxID=6454 RepID=UPI001EB03D65|nr:equilibrative nucleoside transporter 1-like [Haliotis rufescens]XP_046369025.1 equilibrative nucleoside transporter 1-like [Haliotis rufescens]XP_048249298.1 equilibrative nucleoside transporter 1-like [Haliotis rufescens]
MTSRNRAQGESLPLSTFGKRGGDEEGTHVVTNSLYANPWKNSPNRNGTPDGGTSEERLRFLPPPVKLDPGWEATDRNPDELNFRLQTKVEELEKQQPSDRFFLVYIIMVIHGIGILMPWNMFINAKDYFENFKLNSTETSNDRVAEYSKNFMSYVGIFSQVPNVLMSAFNLFCQCGSGSPSLRIVLSLLIMVCVFIVTVVLAMIDTFAWPELFFWVTMASVAVLNMACGIYQNSMYGVAANLPMRFTNAIVLGNNLSGTLVAVFNIISIVISPNTRTAAIYYFVTAIVCLLIAFDAYYILPLTRFYRHFKMLVKLKKEASPSQNQSESCGQTIRRYWSVFKEIWVLIFCVWFVFFVSLMLFPAIQSDIERIHFPISDAYFKPIFCFLNFNFFALLGNITTELVKVPGPRFVWIPIVIRGLFFIPFYVLCNFRPEVRTIPVLINNDYVYIIGAALMAFTSGYFSSLCMMYAPKQVAPENAGTAGMMMAFFLVLGISCGINSSLGLVKLVEIF